MFDADNEAIAVLDELKKNIWTDAKRTEIIAAALRAAERAGMERGLEQAARFVESHVRKHMIGDGRIVWSEDDGPDRNQQAYAAAIRALAAATPAADT